ncbi:uncleaved alkaline protease [Peziza echinospora]|nr:uncleaved alkaline protease [Peziza echinospora]
MLFNVASVLLFVLPAVFAGPIPGPLKAGDIIPGQYIVVLKDDVSSITLESHQDYVVQRKNSRLASRGLETISKATAFTHTYNFGKIKGYAGKFDAETIEEIANRPEVAYVEADKLLSTNALVTQTAVPSWGLARISHRATGATTYVYDSTAGQGIYAYILDTGVYAAHSEFGGRASAGYNAITTETAVDGHGHGTHVAGTIAGTTYGVAKKANVIGVKVLSSAGSGSNSGIIAGLQWVVSDCQSKGRIGKAVANMSLGGSYTAALNNAVAAAVSAGIPFAVAAGNDNANAANYSPASTPSAITVGATTSTDARASYSNFGTLLDVFAPGSSITSAWIGSTSAVNTISGTSMASPHIAGLSAYLMAAESLTTPAQVLDKIVSYASTGLVTSPGTGSVNRLAYNGSGL